MRGAESKQIVTNKILEMFPGSFQYDKELRIPLVEGGEEVQIKVALTCAKTNVNAGSGSVTPQTATAPTNLNVTKEEKEQVLDLVNRLGL